MITRLQDGDDGDPGALPPEARARLLPLLAEAFGNGGVPLEFGRCVVVEARSEVRLRFNALTPVESWTLAVELCRSGQLVAQGEAEFFHWLRDDEWELVQVSGLA